MAQLKSRNGEMFPLLADSLNYLNVQRKNLRISPQQSEDTKCAILRTPRSGWMLIDHTGFDTFVDGLRVADCRQIKEGSRIQLVMDSKNGFEVEVDLQEIVEYVVTEGDYLLKPDSKGKLPKCFVNFKGFSVGEKVILCPRCASPHHLECWLYNERTCAGCHYRDHMADQKAQAEGE